MMSRRVPPVVGALACALSVALGAYASHAAAGQARERLALAALFAFGHGLALLATDSRASVLAGASKLCFILGILLFSGSLAGAALFSVSTRLAPLGGTLMILGWLVLAIDCWKHPGGSDGPV